MKRLESIKLIQFLLYEDEEFRVGKPVAFSAQMVVVKAQP